MLLALYTYVTQHNNWRLLNTKKIYTLPLGEHCERHLYHVTEIIIIVFIVIVQTERKI
jgi:hypothetical protein